MGMAKTPRDKKGQFTKGTHWRTATPIREREWLYEQYVTLKRASGDIAKDFGYTDSAVLFWLKKHGIPRRTTREIRQIKHWGTSGSDNPMWNKKGELNPRWKGGITPERQSFYLSSEWKSACSGVWKRDNATCQRCGVHKADSPDIPFHIHHIESFAIVEKRADTKNLILLCEICHHWVHSKKNTKKEFLR